MSSRRVAVLITASGALLWGTLGPVVGAWSTLGGGQTAFARSVVAAVTLAAFAGRAVADWRQAWRNVRWLVVGGIGVAGFQFAYFAALGRAGVAVSTAIGIGLAPAMTGLWSRLNKVPPTRSWLAATAIAVLGLACLALGSGATQHVSASGIAWAVLAAAFFSAQIVAIDSMRPPWSQRASLAWMFGIAALLLAPLATGLIVASGVAGSAEGGAVDAGQIAVIGYLGAVTGGVAYWLFATGTKVVGAAPAATLSLLEPVGAALLAVAVLGERPTMTQWLGITLLVGSVAVAARASGTKPESIPCAP